MSVRRPSALGFASDDGSSDLGAVVIRALAYGRSFAGVGVFAGVADRRLVVGADDAERVLVRAGISGIGDVALSGRVGDQEQNESADDQEDEDGGDYVSHALALPGAQGG